MSHIVHELKLFNDKTVYDKSIKEVIRVLKSKGNFIVIDHRDPGPGDVLINIGNNLDLLKRFQEKFILFSWKMVS